LLTGQYFHAIDAKSRLTIPAKLREKINPSEEGYGFMAVHGYDKVLYLYTPETFNRVSQAFDSSLQTDPDVRNYERIRYGLTTELELDRLGRVLIPESARQQCGLKRDVAVVGVRDHIEIWDKEKWDAFIEERLAEHDQLAERAMTAAARAGDAAGAVPDAGDST
jgi:MraZ protein